ncbi:MAG: ATP-binding protein [Veillonellaceae bacterium]|jgi:anti-sigma regulatory factor (Ser/Thr protein kinase)|nr:ATP-binding protein [Veillonellaceae bacterium]
MRELSLHILDLVQNSLEAGSSEVSLVVIEDLANDKLVITVSDNGRGMSESKRNSVSDPFVTSRHTRRVGLGLPLVDMYTQLCNGSMNIQSQPGAGTTVQAIFQYSHFDRPPLGNMVETIKTIIIANPGLLFKYTHKVGDKTFQLSTHDITEALGDVPLSFPEVIVWLDEYLTTNLDGLYGGAEHEND